MANISEKQKKYLTWAGIIIGAYLLFSFVGVIPYEYNMVEKYITDGDSASLEVSKETRVYGITEELNLTEYSYNHIAIQFYQESGFTDDISVDISVEGLSGVTVKLVAMNDDWTVSMSGYSATYHGFLDEGDRVSGLALEVIGNDAEGEITIDVDGTGIFDVDNDTIEVTYWESV